MNPKRDDAASRRLLLLRCRLQTEALQHTLRCLKVQLSAPEVLSFTHHRRSVCEEQQIGHRRSRTVIDVVAKRV